MHPPSPKSAATSFALALAAWRAVARRALARAFLLLMLMAGTGLAQQDAGRPLVVGSEEDFPPFAIGKTDDTAGGFTVELWKAVAAEQALNYTIRVLPFRQLLDEFKAGKIDVMLNLAQSDERRAFADFSVPHVVVNGAIFVRKGESRIRSEADLAGKAILVLNADLAHDYAISKGWERQLVLVATGADGLKLLASGQHDAMLLGKLAGIRALQALKIRNVTALDSKAGFSQRFSFAVQKGNSELLAKVNEGLALAKSIGPYDVLYEKWFGVFEVREVTLRHLLKYLGPLVIAFLIFFGFFLVRQHASKQAGQLLRASEVKLRELNENLERRVLERTDELRASEAQFRSLAENSPDLILRFDRQFRHLYGNPAIEARTGFRAAAMQGKTDFEVGLPPALVEQLQAQMQRVFETGQLVEFEWTLPTPMGDRTLLSRFAPERSLDGTVESLLAVATDITERKRAEEELMESRRRLQFALEGGALGPWDWNPQTGAAVYGDFWAELLEYRPDEVEAHVDFFKRHIHSEDLPDVLNRLTGHLEGRLPEYRSEHRLRTKSGRCLWILDRGKIAERDKEGRVVRLTGVIFDITVRKQAEAELAIANQELVFQNEEKEKRAAELVVANQELVFQNEEKEKRAAELTQHREHLEQKVAERTEELEAARRAALSLMQDAQSEKQRAEQNATQLAASKQALRKTYDDLQCANLRLERASRHKDEFLANMSHELRTPLNAILGLSEALLENTTGTLTPRQLKSITTIFTSGTHLLALINDILDLAKIEAGKLDLHREFLNTDEFCQACLAFIRMQAMKKQIAVAFEANERVAKFEADPKRFKQILVNLLTNAVKFTPEGGRIGLKVSAPEGGNMLHFCVWDTGVGIAPADQSRLFQAFTQIDSGLSRRQEGTGLGLALVARLAELHGGSVTLESEPGKGSRFTVTLPVKTSADLDGETGGLAAAPKKLRRALVVEDDTGIGKLLIGCLEGRGFGASPVVTGDDVMERSVRERPQVILMDIELPGWSGWRLLQLLKAHPETHDIPVVVVSGTDDPEKSRELGAAAHFTKPFKIDEVMKLVQQLTAAPAAERGSLILLAEDNEASIQTVGGYLEDHGYAMCYAKNGIEAVKLALDLRPALILMDIQMPVMDGLTAIREIRADAALKNIPIVALTALAMPGDRERCLAMGATEYMSKPVSLKTLAELVNRLLQAGKATHHSR